MGLKATIKIDGVPLGYHRISQLSVDVNHLNYITVFSYIDQDERDTEDDPEAPRPYCHAWIVQTDYDPDMSVNSAYDFLKTLAEFEDAEDIIENWAPGKSYFYDDEVMDEGEVYQCKQPHTSAPGQEPHLTPALWVKKKTEWEDWVQPQSTNPYMKGDKVKHNGKKWVSTIDYNVFEPGVAGWEEWTE